MPRPIGIVNSFTTGEISPAAYGRTDLDKYAAGLTCCNNFLVDPLGGIQRRPGLRFVCETKFSQFSSRVFPFQANVTSNYVIEAGCQYLRLFGSSAPINLTPQLVTNGTFDADISGWTGINESPPNRRFLWSSLFGGSAFLGVDALGGSVGMRQDVATTSGLVHSFTFNVESILASNGGSLAIQVGSTSGGSDLLNTSTTTTGAYAYSVTSTSTTISITLTYSRNGGPAGSAYVDDVALSAVQPLEITTPYDYAQLRDIDVVQSADEQYWLHACHKTRKLSRYSNTCWKFNCVGFSPPPSIEYGARPAFDVQPSALTGTAVTFTAFNNLGGFLGADKDREIQITSGTNAGARAGIVSVTSASQVVGYVCVPFLTTGINCAGTWRISGSPISRMTITDNAPVGKSANLTLTTAGWRQGGTTPGETDVGKFVLVNGGCYEITCVPSTTVAYTIIRSEATATTTAEATAGSFSLEEALWSCTRGFASTGDFFEDRLWLDAASYKFVGSKSGDYENFAGGVADDDGVQFGINSKTINTIRGIIGGRQLQIFTTGGEYTARGGTDSPITPTAILLSNETTHGASGVTPIRVSDVTLFLTRFGKQLREFTQRADVVSDAFVAPDLLLLASHLTQTSGIVELAYQREPTSTIWAIRADGVLLSCAYRREENVVAWAKHNTCGTFESVCVIPHPDGDREQVWFIVNRTINGSTKRYVEYLDDSTLVYDRRLTDSAVVFNNCVPVTTFTVPHLAGELVHIQADGAYVGTCVAAASTGLVGIATPASKVEIGLGYVSEAITLEPEISFGAGSIQPMKKHWVRAFARVKDSCSLLVRTPGGQSEYFRDQRGNVMRGSGVKDYDVPRLGDFTTAKITVRQEAPLPAHILMIGGVLDVNEA